MMNKEKRKVLGRNIAWFFLRVFTSLNSAFSLKWSYFLGEVLGGLAYCIVIPHRRIAFDSLKIAFPALKAGDYKNITRNFFVFMAQSAFELLYILKNPKALENTTIHGKEYLDKALKKGNGIIMITAHIGNFPLLSLKLAKEGYPVYFVTRPMRDERVGDYLHSLRTKAGVKTIFSYPRRECVNTIIKVLHANEIVIMQMDQNFGSSGIWVKFFGKLAATPVGPITLALRTRAALVPAFIYRQDFNRHCLEMSCEEELTITANKDETILLNTIKFSRIIEGWIRRYPWQWGWIHRRWKSPPPKSLDLSSFKIER